MYTLVSQYLKLRELPAWICVNKSSAQEHSSTFWSARARQYFPDTLQKISGEISLSHFQRLLEEERLFLILLFKENQVLISELIRFRKQFQFNFEFGPIEDLRAIFLRLKQVLQIREIRSYLLKLQILLLTGFRANPEIIQPYLRDIDSSTLSETVFILLEDTQILAKQLYQHQYLLINLSEKLRNRVINAIQKILLWKTKEDVYLEIFQNSSQIQMEIT